VNRKTFFPLLLVLVLTFIGCTNQTTQKDTDRTTGFLDKPVSIFNADKGSKQVSSYQASVQNFYSNNRTGVNMEQYSDYRLSLKIIGGEVISRIDYAGNYFQDGQARSIISNSVESIVLIANTDEIESRTPISSIAKKIMPENATKSLMGRVDLNQIASYSRSMSFNITDSTPGILTIGIPSDFFPVDSAGADFNSRVVSYNVSYDTQTEVEIQSSMEIHESDGTIISVTSYPLYEEIGNDKIKVGQVTVMNNDIPGVLDTTDSVIKDTPSLEELGNFVLSEDSDPVLFGDPTSPDKEETFVELYQDIKLNSLEDSFFRVSLLKKEKSND
jgi:hypothetical protein